MRIRAIFAAGLSGALCAVLIGSSAAPAADKDCGDFASQAAAQRFFLSHGGPRSDPHRLDDTSGNGNGLACETNDPPYMGLTTLKYKRGAYRGGLKAVKGACIRNRNVTVLKVKPGKDRIIGTDASNSGGKYAVPRRRGSGRFYGKVAPKGQCVAERSRRIRL